MMVMRPATQLCLRDDFFDLNNQKARRLVVREIERKVKQIHKCLHDQVGSGCAHL